MAATNKLLIRGGQVYDHDGDVHHPPVADILIENDRIAAVGPRLATEGNRDNCRSRASGSGPGAGFPSRAALASAGSPCE
jgi:hypothetical protein